MTTTLNIKNPTRALQVDNERLNREVVQLRRENQGLRQENEVLRRRLEVAQLPPGRLTPTSAIQPAPTVTIEPSIPPSTAPPTPGRGRGTTDSDVRFSLMELE